jgi:hypothetical protein
MKRTLCVLLFALVPIVLAGQPPKLSGLIKDSKGGPIPKAAVELRDQNSGIQWKATTNRDGLYKFRDLKAGLYQATVQAQGFKTLTRDGIRLAAEEKAELNFTLEPSTASQ